MVLRSRLIVLYCFSTILTCMVRNGHGLENAVVATTKGPIKGEILLTRNYGVEYYSFKGIPYAEPPVGDLRFEPPQEANPWDEITNATNFGNSCPQMGTDGVTGEEDCLFLNVYTKKISPDVLKPVMVWIHGGFLALGSGNSYGPDFIVEKDIVLVTANYRLNVLGFLSLGDENAYGNMGLKDQVFALRWVRENIERFGGNPERVTVFGQSAGGHSVDYLTITPLTKGLFQQVIGQSGSSISVRGFQPNPKKYADILLKHFGIESNDSREIIKKLREIDYKELVAQSFNFREMTWDTFYGGHPFGPVVEVNHTGAIITRAGYQDYQKGEFNKVPFMLGFNTNDATVTQGVLTSLNISYDVFDDDVKVFASPSLNLLDDDARSEVGKQVREHFIGSSSYTKNYRGLLNFLSQETYGRAVRKTADLRRSYVNGYFYRFSYITDTASQFEYGTPHGGELRFIFYIPERYSNFSSRDWLMQKQATELWTNFAKTGNPILGSDGSDILGGVEWNPVNATDFPFLDIGVEITSGVYPNRTDFEFWDDIFEKYGNCPLLTY